jgi:hypothetical protein
MTIEAIDWARLAAYIDGEGSIQIRPHRARSNHALNISITNTDYRLLVWLESNFGGKIYKVVGCKTTTKKHVWRWEARAAGCRPILEGCLPYFIVKREQAEIAIAFKNLCELQKSTKEVVKGQFMSEEALAKRQAFVVQIRAARDLGAKEEAS